MGVLINLEFWSLDSGWFFGYVKIYGYGFEEFKGVPLELIFWAV